MAYTTEHIFIGGKWSRPSCGDQLKVQSPASGEVIGWVPKVTIADIDAAVSVARRAFDHGEWPRMSFKDRAAALRRVAAELAARRETLAKVLAEECGLPIEKWAASSVDAAVAMLGYFADLGETIELEEFRAGVFADVIVRREPVGVVAGVMPWNSPLAITHMFAAPALVAGCCIIVKPAPETPLHAQIMAQAYEAAGLEPGVVSVLPAERDVSEALVSHNGVDKVCFTGSTATGRRIASICGNSLRRYSLELGGKSAAIVLPDADISAVAPALVAIATMNNCEACVGQTRILAPADRYAELVEAFTQGVAELKVGDPLDPETDLGPLITEKQRNRVESYVTSGLTEGAKLALVGGRPPERNAGWYLNPFVFRDVDNSMRVAQEEIFGPVISLIPYHDEADAVRIANDSIYGLSGTIWTSDVDRGINIARQVRSGNYGVNTFGIDFVAPFGGFKQSGIGRQMGPEGLDAFFEYKSIHLPKNLPGRPR